MSMISNPADDIAGGERKRDLANETTKSNLLYEEAPAFQALAAPNGGMSSTSDT